MIDMLDLSKATILNSPADVASWPVDASITRINVTRDNTVFEFTKQGLESQGGWPSFQAPWAAPGELMQVTLWGFEFINNEWYGSGIIQRWVGGYNSGDSFASYRKDWFYDAPRWAPMSNKELLPGDKFGYMLTNSDARNNGVSGFQRRSNVVVVTIPSEGVGDFTFENTNDLPAPSPVLQPPPNQDIVVQLLYSINDHLAYLASKV